MKVKELMIGDWVYIFDPDHKEEKEAYKVSEIREEGIRTHMFDDTYEEDWFDPIPLTPKILKANGFVDRGDAGFQRLRTEDTQRHLTIYLLDGYFFDGNPDFEKEISGVKHIKYVHQLQHALRICNLNNLADNFKIS